MLQTLYFIRKVFQSCQNTPVNQYKSSQLQRCHLPSLCFLPQVLQIPCQSPIPETLLPAQHFRFCLVLLFLSCTVSVSILSQLSDSEPRSGNGAAQNQPRVKASRTPGPQTTPPSRAGLHGSGRLCGPSATPHVHCVGRTTAQTRSHLDLLMQEADAHGDAHLFLHII